VESVIFVACLVGGVGLRLLLQPFTNFTPVAAISLFAGYFFRSWLVAACLPLLIMGTTDYFIGGYDERQMVLIHAALALPVFCRGILRRHCKLEERQFGRYFATVFGTSLAASCTFFLISNFGTWCFGTMYEHTVGGLARCYVNALPFFRPTLTGDLVFSLGLFGGYAAAVTAGWISHLGRWDHFPAQIVAQDR
jgi:hypothetical protein